MSNSFKWLHLSDFHTGKDNYGQIKLFTYIHDHIRQNMEKGFFPDAVFITGDIANKGLTAEYDMFFKEFIEPLSDVYGTLPRIYIVPGNHDIDRNQCEQAAKSLYTVLEESGSKFFDADTTGFGKRKEIFARFDNFQDCVSKAGKDVCYPVKEIFDEKGAYTDVLSIGQKKIGIVGINTAWLSNSDKDKEKLSPGKYILEEALNVVKDCEYKIVLGHHPLDWLQGEQRQQITTLLIKNKAMYLHGHMHKNSGNFMLAYNMGSLILQSGAAFQERENEIYYNSLQWGELDFQSEEVTIKPKKWSVEKQDFIMDSPDRLLMGRHKDGQDCWQFPYALSNQEEPSERNKKLIKSLTGWKYIKQQFNEKIELPSDDEILKYFDGKEPDYNYICSSRTPVRKIVTTITKDFIRCNEENGIKCGLIIGAGGEGKTTVLLQTVRELTEKYRWHALVLKYSNKHTVVPIDTILEVTKKGNWVICADNCFPVAGKLFELLEELSKEGRRHVHLLLCTRILDWKNCKANQLQWNSYSSYSRYKLRGIEEEDAKEIVTAWANLGKKGLGKLSELSIPEAAEQLCLSAKDEMDKDDSDEGALLGAMLTARYGEELNVHVYEMLSRLKEIYLQKTPLKGRTLLDAYAYIAAMHSEGLNLLYKDVIAQICGLQPSDVRKCILAPLGDEAAIAINGEVIYTRHILIAQAARKIMEEEFDYDFDEIFIELSKSAMDVINEIGVKPEYVDWKYLGDHFFKKNQSLAFDLYQSVLDKSPKDPQMTVHLSEKYRELGQFDPALALFRNEEEKINHRPSFCEWALAEANVNNRFTSVCLSALAVSDDISTEKLDKRNACINLHAIARTFYELYSQDREDDYLRAALSAIRLGEKIDAKDVKIRQFIKNTLPKFPPEIRAEDLQYGECLQKGIKIAAKNAELNFKSWIPHMDTLKFNKLFAMAERSHDKKQKR
ncbi:MAG: metallophosphoesterase [Lachnospiraceae bacterium]|nr:metallophosphoesterase [Lachnospiraceae bacterium]